MFLCLDYVTVTPTFFLFKKSNTCDLTSELRFFKGREGAIFVELKQKETRLVRTIFNDNKIYFVLILTEIYRCYHISELNKIIQP